MSRASAASRGAGRVSVRSSIPSERSESRGAPISLLNYGRRWHRRLVPWVYILRCADGSFYVGHTTDLDGRVQTHNDGRGGRYTAARRPVSLLYFEQFASVSAAIARERQVKRWSGRKKDALVRGDTAALTALSRRRRSARGPKSGT